MPLPLHKNGEKTMQCSRPFFPQDQHTLEVGPHLCVQGLNTLHLSCKMSGWGHGSASVLSASRHWICGFFPVFYHCKQCSMALTVALTTGPLTWRTGLQACLPQWAWASREHTLVTLTGIANAFCLPRPVRWSSICSTCPPLGADAQSAASLDAPAPSPEVA